MADEPSKCCTCGKEITEYWEYYWGPDWRIIDKPDEKICGACVQQLLSEVKQALLKASNAQRRLWNEP